MHSLPSWLRFTSLGSATLLQYIYRGFTAFTAIFVLMNVAVALPFFNNRGKINLLVSHIGAFSLGIYVVHLIFMGMLFEGLFLLIPAMPKWCVILVLFLLSSIISYYGVMLLNKNKCTARFLLGKI